MFSDSASANSTLALKYVIDKVLVPSSKASKKVQNMIQAAVVFPSGYEVTEGIVPNVGLNGKRSGGDKSGDMLIKRQRVDEEMQVAFERNVNINERKQETNELQTNGNSE